MAIRYNWIAKYNWIAALFYRLPNFVGFHAKTRDDNRNGESFKLEDAITWDIIQYVTQPKGFIFDWLIVGLVRSSGSQAAWKNENMWCVGTLSVKF